MRSAISAAAIVLTAVAAVSGAARADWFDSGEWYRWVQSLLASPDEPRPPPRRDVIVPPADIDPRMSVAPPSSSGDKMPVIRPPERPPADESDRSKAK